MSGRASRQIDMGLGPPSEELLPTFLNLETIGPGPIQTARPMLRTINIAARRELARPWNLEIETRAKMTTTEESAARIPILEREKTRAAQSISETHSDRVSLWRPDVAISFRRVMLAPRFPRSFAYFVKTRSKAEGRNIFEQAREMVPID